MEEWTGRMRYAIAFDLDTDKLKTLYGSPYNNAYVEIKKVLEQFNFIGQQGNLYFSRSEEENAVKCMLAVQTLSRDLKWFDKCVKDIRMLRIEDNNDLKPVLFTNFNKKTTLF